MSSELQRRPARLRDATSSSASPGLALVPPPLLPAGRDASSDEQRIVRTGAHVSAGAVVATFALDAVPHPMWRGAFGRALEGTLAGAAGRWHLDRSTITVTRVETGRGGAVAVAIEAAVVAANEYVVARADAHAAALAAADAAELGLRADASDAASAIHAALGV